MTGHRLTAEVFACLVQARRTVRGRWKARCPAHADHSPSLSIRASLDGGVLLHCYAGCTVEAILAILKLARRDLFSNRSPLLSCPRLAGTADVLIGVLQSLRAHFVWIARLKVNR